MTGKWVEVEAPANIALIKYWGKRDEELILPLNDSLSLSVCNLRAKTRVEVVEKSGEDTVSINGKEVEKIKGSRFEKAFDEVRRLLRKRKHSDNGDCPQPVSFRVSSTTNFPVAAGLASSAAGFAAIAYAMGRLFEFTEAEVSRIARIGSGSACRSVGEGLVHWHAGTDSAGMDCVSESLFSYSHWPDLRAVILVMNENEKETSSTIGMRNTVETSTLLKHRVEVVVPERVKKLKLAFEERDFLSLAHIIMADSNQFHAVCMDTLPPLRYMTDASWEVVRLVHEFNKEGVRAAYTFDAGPNACVFLSESDLSAFLSTVCERIPVSEEPLSRLVEEGLLAKDAPSDTPAVIKNVIVSRVGEGPCVIDSGSS